MNPGWISAVWPIVLFTGGALWFGGKYKGVNESIRDQIKEVDGATKVFEERHRLGAERLDRLENRLTAAETHVSNQGRTLDRIESKLDRLIERRSVLP